MRTTIALALLLTATPRALAAAPKADDAEAVAAAGQTAIQKADWKVTYLPAATITHHVGASKSKVSPRIIWLRHMGMLHYFRKHHRPNPLALAMVSTLVVLRAGLMLIGNAFRPPR